ncbi:unnamed protein product [Orchesella dallaii]|uniref:C2H2-type domain-containing protein n=1 Tax=Orchesella dallaii TaxID=48710 RepID=A0ABP1R781_9HEXA
MDYNPRQNYASTISDCWNNNNLSFGAQPLPTIQEQTSSCLLCSNIVLLNQNDYGFSTYVTERLALANRSRMLKNLCFHLKISNQNIPSECPRSISPLCIACEGLMKQLWRYQGILDRIGFEISKIVTSIEKTVVDEEILKTLQTTRFQGQGLLSLRELILDEYRNKILRRKQMRSSARFCQGTDNFNSILDMRQRIQDSVITSPSTSACYSARSERLGLGEMSESHAQNNPIQEVGERAEIYAAEPCSSSSSSIFIAPEVTYERPQSINEETENECLIINNEGQEETFNYREQEGTNLNQDCNQGCDLVISGVRGGNSTIMGLPMNQIKSEIGQPNIEIVSCPETDLTIAGEQDSDADDILSVEPRQRRLLCEGVEIYKCYTDPSKPGRSNAYLQCSLCNLTLTVPRKGVPGKATSLMKMRCHVREAHKDKMRKTKSKTKRMLLTCPQCPEKFRGKKSLREHKKSHGLQCDICGRPIPGNSMRNLLTHKFSHKNDEERRAALAAKEKGTRVALLSGKIRKNRNLKGRKSTSILKHLTQNLTCNICNRTFPRKNYLQLHMKSHKNTLKTTIIPVKHQAPVFQRICEAGTNT